MARQWRVPSCGWIASRAREIGWGIAQYTRKFAVMTKRRRQAARASVLVDNRRLSRKLAYSRETAPGCPIDRLGMDHAMAVHMILRASPRFMRFLVGNAARWSDLVDSSWCPNQRCSERDALRTRPARIELLSRGATVTTPMLGSPPKC